MGKNEKITIGNEKRNEKIILAIISCYSLGMILVGAMLNWSSYISPMISLGILLIWILFLGKYRDFRFRMNIYAFIALFDFTLYAMRAESLYHVLTPLAAISLILGISALPEILWLVNIDTIILCFFHILVLQTVPFQTLQERGRALIIIGSILVVEIIMYFHMKEQENMICHMQSVIDELEAAENSKSDFLSNVSHEIRTPINVVCGMSELLQMEKLSGKVSEYVGDIQKAGRNLNRLVSNILNFTELQSDNIAVHEDAYLISDTVQNVVDMAIAQLDDKKVDIVVDCDTQIPRSIIGDEYKIRRIMNNLMDNAIKFTPDGCIQLSIRYRMTSDGINLIVALKDTGVGIKEENLEKIYTDFNQADTRRNRQEGGIGLGFSISNALVQRMGGFIKVKSEWNKGTEVQFVIPQQIRESKPLINLTNSKDKRVISYINYDKYNYDLSRESYEKLLQHMEEQLQIQLFKCRNILTLKRRITREFYTHVWIGWDEYSEDRKYFEELAGRIQVFLIASDAILKENHWKKEDSKITVIYKPISNLILAKYLDENEVQQGREHFVAPDASILIVDDSLMNLKVAKGFLKAYQMQVLTAVSGQEALEMIENKEFDCIFMDHMMPDMDGVETLHRIRQKTGAYYQRVPVIAFTANVVGESREMFLQEGFHDFLTKPLERIDLEQVLHKYVPDNKKKYEVQSEQTEQSEENRLRKQKKEKDCSSSLRKNKHVDIELGISYCGGSMEDYKEIALVYCTEGEQKLKFIQDYYDAADWKNYAILVHALKSTSLGIGAIELSEMAKDLEFAGKKDDELFIWDKHSQMVDLFHEVVQELQDMVES